MGFEQIGFYEVTESFCRDYSGETACNRDVWEVQPGLYPVRTDGYWLMVEFGDQPLVESFRQNRVFTATSNRHETWKVGEKISRCPSFQLYRYELDGLVESGKVTLASTEATQGA